MRSTRCWRRSSDARPLPLPQTGSPTAASSRPRSRRPADDDSDAPTIAFAPETRTAVLPTTAVPPTTALPPTRAPAPTPTQALRTKQRRGGLILIAVSLVVVVLALGAAFALGAFDGGAPATPAVEVPEVTTAPTLATTTPTVPPASVPVVDPGKTKAAPAPKVKNEPKAKAAGKK